MATKTQAFKRYTWGMRGANLPQHDVDWSCGRSDRAEVITAAGMDPADEELVVGVLLEAWNGHPAGAVVVSGLTVAGFPFAVSTASAGG
jgi:hypothetical protein